MELKLLAGGVFMCLLDSELVGSCYYSPLFAFALSRWVGGCPASRPVPDWTDLFVHLFLPVMDMCRHPLFRLLEG